MPRFFRLNISSPAVAMVAVALSLTAISTSWAQTNTSTLRLATWNVTNYAGAGSRDSDFQNAFYGTFQGRTFAPDILLGQEFTSQTAVNSFVNLLNSGLTAATGETGDWAAATFSNGPDTDNAFFYRTGKVEFLGQAIVSAGAPGNSNPPRDTNRYDVRIRADIDNTPLSLYSSHMASQGNPASRRRIEAQRIRANAQSLPVGTTFILGGDFNIVDSDDLEYQDLVGSQTNNVGRFFDPINTPSSGPGEWQNNNA
ncbi:MAG: hypothetical protein H8F28_26060, partial [Fibrella sp.]|nr:hypothetical protein [Armatimonadota bacterium]